MKTLHMLSILFERLQPTSYLLQQVKEKLFKKECWYKLMNCELLIYYAKYCQIILFNTQTANENFYNGNVLCGEHFEAEM